MLRKIVGLLSIVATAGLLSAVPPAHGPLSLPRPSEPYIDFRNIETLVDQLRSLQYASRESATGILLRLNPDALPYVRAALIKETDPEAIARLTDVAVHLFLKAKTSFEGKMSLLGVRLHAEYIRLAGEEELTQCLAVSGIQPGFPAFDNLHVGDRLIAMDGQRFDFPKTPDELRDDPVEDSVQEISGFRLWVNKRSPGAMLHLTLIRDGKSMVVDVRLAGLAENDDQLLSKTIQERNDGAADFLNEIRAEMSGKPAGAGQKDASQGARGGEASSKFELPLIPPQPVEPAPITAPQEMQTSPK